MKKRLIALAMCLTMGFSFTIPSFAKSSGNTITAALDHNELTVSDSDQKVSLTIASTAGMDLDGISYTLTVPASLEVSSIVSGNNEFSYGATDYNLKKSSTDTTETAYVGWSTDKEDSGNYTGVTTIGVAEITVPGGTPAGEYAIQVDDIELTKDYGDIYENEASSVVVLTIKDVQVSPGYIVTMSSDAPAAGVAKGGSFNVNLDVDNSEATTFNAFYSILTYDDTKVSYAGSETIGDFTVDTSDAGKLKISRTGSEAAIGETPELTLPFQAVAAGDASLELTKANVDVAANAEKDAPAATVSGSPLTVKVLETYTVTFTGGEGATGTAPTMDPAAAGSEIQLPDNTFTRDGFTFSGWNDGTADYAAGATYTMPEKAVTFTAQWTENVTVTPASANPSAYFGSQYKLIAATINAEGYVPTYGGDEMYLVQGYEDNTYYYVIDGAYDSSKFGYREGSATTIVKLDYDVNQTKLVDINDAQFVYNIYNGTPPTQNIVQRLLLADTNRDKTVGTQDCAVVVQNIA